MKRNLTLAKELNFGENFPRFRFKPSSSDKGKSFLSWFDLIVSVSFVASSAEQDSPSDLASLSGLENEPKCLPFFDAFPALQTRNRSVVTI